MEIDSIQRVVEDCERGRVHRLRADLTVVDVDGCVSVYSPHSQQVLSLNETASEIWRLIGHEHCGTDQVVSLLATRYAVQPEAIRADVERVVSLFENEGLYDDEDADTGDEPGG